jgi:hypothetical protein
LPKKVKKFSHLCVPGMTHWLSFWNKGAGSNKTPADTGRKGNANKASALPETGCLEEA